jgi:hypothetical protein
LCSRKGDEKFKEIKEKYLINDQHIPVIKNWNSIAFDEYLVKVLTQNDLFYS